MKKLWHKLCTIVEYAFLLFTISYGTGKLMSLACPVLKENRYFIAGFCLLAGSILILSLMTSIFSSDKEEESPKNNSQGS